MREAQRLIKPDRTGVGLVDVQHRLRQTATAQVPQSGNGECSPQTAARHRRINADDVDLTDRFVTVTRSVVITAVHFRPVEADELAVTFGEKETVRVEPRLAFTDLHFVDAPPALLGVAFEGPVVQRCPR